MKRKLQTIIKKENINSLYIFLIMLLFAIIICSNFFSLHFSQDTYCITAYGYDKYIKHFLSIGRILGAAQIFITKTFNIPFDFMIIFSSIFGTLFLTLSWFMVYSHIIKMLDIRQNKKKNVLIAGISFSIVFNFCTVETLVFAESAVLGFSIFCSTLAACVFTSDYKGKNIKTAILLFLTVIAYQTSTSLFLIIALVFIAIKNKNNKVEILKNSIYTFLIYGVSMLLGLLITRFMGSYLNLVERETTLLTIKEMIQTLFKYLDFIVLKNFYIKTIWYNFSIIIFLVFIFIILIIKNKQYFHILEYFVLIILGCILPIIPLMVIPIGSQYMEPRMAMIFGSLAGILLLYLIAVMNAYEKKKIGIVISIITIVLFVMNSSNFIRSSAENLATGYIDRNIANSIIYNIEKYEEENNKKIKKIVFGYDASPTYYYDGQIMLRSINGRGLATNFTVVPLIQYYSEKKYEMTISQEVINEKFSKKNWDAFSEDQLIFDKDTLYFCIY